jgi:hypothetical protein
VEAEAAPEEGAAAAPEVAVQVGAVPEVAEPEAAVLVAVVPEVAERGAAVLAAAEPELEAEAVAEQEVVAPEAGVEAAQGSIDPVSSKKTSRPASQARSGTRNITGACSGAAAFCPMRR